MGSPACLHEFDQNRPLSLSLNKYNGKFPNTLDFGLASLSRGSYRSTGAYYTVHCTPYRALCTVLFLCCGCGRSGLQLQLQYNSGWRVTFSYTIAQSGIEPNPNPKSTNAASVLYYVRPACGTAQVLLYYAACDVRCIMRVRARFCFAFYQAHSDKPPPHTPHPPIVLPPTVPCTAHVLCCIIHWLRVVLLYSYTQQARPVFIFIFQLGKCP
jgi:hypothetical protein